MMIEAKPMSPIAITLPRNAPTHYITDPKGRQESVQLAESGLAASKRLAGRYFDLVEDAKSASRK